MQIATATKQSLFSFVRFLLVVFDVYGDHYNSFFSFLFMSCFLARFDLRTGVGTFRGGRGLSSGVVSSPINVREAYALHEIFKLCSVKHPERLAGSKGAIEIDKKTLFHAFRNVRASDSRMHEIIATVFWLQVGSDVTLDLISVSSKGNKEAEDPSRPESGEYIRLGRALVKLIVGHVGRF